MSIILKFQHDEDNWTI